MTKEPAHNLPYSENLQIPIIDASANTDKEAVENLVALLQAAKNKLVAMGIPSTSPLIGKINHALATGDLNELRNVLHEVLEKGPKIAAHIAEREHLQAEQLTKKEEKEAEAAITHLHKPSPIETVKQTWDEMVEKVKTDLAGIKEEWHQAESYVEKKAKNAEEAMANATAHMEENLAHVKQGVVAKLEDVGHELEEVPASASKLLSEAEKLV